MGQITVPAIQDLIISATNRVQTRNAGSGNVGNNVILINNDAGRNNTIDDVIVLGVNAFDAGVTDANAAGSVVIGSNAASAITDFTLGTNGPVIVMGRNAIGTLVQGSGVFIGDNLAPEAVGDANGGLIESVCIGHEVLRFQNIVSLQNQQNVIIGNRACRGEVSRIYSVQSSVIIGFEASELMGRDAQGGAIVTSVIIGHRAAEGMATGANTSSQNVLIGNGVASSASQLTESVLIGSGANSGSTQDSNVIIGSGTSCGAASNNTLIGRGAIVTTAGGVIALGTNAMNGAPQTVSHQAVIETVIGATRRTLIYGRMDEGNVYIANVALADRDLSTIASTNALKLPNGTRGAGNPANGGFFYVSAGVLHFVQSDGADITLQIGSAAGQLLRSNVALANNAAAAVGTLTNAPAAGNPTKWIPIDDNGTIRNIPTW